MRSAARPATVRFRDCSWNRCRVVPPRELACVCIESADVREVGRKSCRNTRIRCTGCNAGYNRRNVVDRDSGGTRGRRPDVVGGADADRVYIGSCPGRIVVLVGVACVELHHCRVEIYCCIRRPIAPIDGNRVRGTFGVRQDAAELRQTIFTDGGRRHTQAGNAHRRIQADRDVTGHRRTAIAVRHGNRNQVVTAYRVGVRAGTGPAHERSGQSARSLSYYSGGVC